MQVDARGQLVIPKDIRREIGVDEGTGFLIYSISDEGILLKKIEAEPLEAQKNILDELDQKSNKINLDKSNLKKSVEHYKKTKKGNLELI